MRQMLEDAARAAGIDAKWDDEFGHMVLRQEHKGGTNYQPWMPNDDDGDALRLAVKLRIRSKYHEVLGQGLAWLSGSEKEFQANVEDCGRDECAATRLAITRAAASIGEKMRQEEALRQLSKLSDERGEEL